MKAETFEKRTAKESKNSIAYDLVYNLLHGSKLVRPCYTQGSGRWTSIADHLNETKWMLNRIGLKESFDYTVGNDAPKGGKTGYYIKLTSRGRRKMVK